MHPSEGFGHPSRLVALQRSDEMPVEAKGREFATLSFALLYVIFAKSSLPSIGGLMTAEADIFLSPQAKKCHQGFSLIFRLRREYARERLAG